MNAREDFTGKVVAVTGAARGIGRNIASAFCSAGATVFVCDVNRASGNEAVRDLRSGGGIAEFVAVDLAQAGVASATMDRIAKDAGGLDVLVNNARSGRALALLDETEASWDEGMAVTLKAAFFASQQAVRIMGPRGGGAILNIASIAAFLASHESPTYHIAKAAMVQMTRYLAVAGGQFGVRANCICPGFVVQDEHQARFTGADNAGYRETANMLHPLQSTGTSDDVAELALFLCSDRARFVSGEAVVLDGGASVQEQFSLVRRLSAGRASPGKR